MRPILLIMWTAFQSFILRHNNNNNNRDSTFLSIFAVPKNAVCWITFSPIHFNNFKEYMKRIGVNVSLEVIQKTALLGKAKILRKALFLYEDGKERPGSRGELL